jgi:predicted NAD/FAD-binding protein
MNKLQSLPTQQDVFVTLNPTQIPEPHLTQAIFEYNHPVFDQAAMAAQDALAQLQGRHNLWFAGAYTGYGFHEDGLRSAVNIAKAFGVTPPWQTTSDEPKEVRHA